MYLLNIFFSPLRTLKSESQYWMTLATSSISQRYKRSIIGPFWTTIMVGIQALTMSIIVTFIFKGEIEKFIPYVCLGIIFWGFVTSIINESATVFQNYKNYILQFNKPYYLYVAANTFKNFISLTHNFTVYLIIMFIFGIYPSFFCLLIFIINFCFICFTLSWLSFFIAVLGIRYRDIPPMISALFIMLFWLTPIIYTPSQLGEISFILDYNFFTHIIDLLRKPFFNEIPSLINYLYLIIFNILGIPLLLIFYKKVKNSIIFWL